MWTAIKAGRTVATSGPLLLFTANGKTAGETIAINSDQPQTVAISTFVRSLEYLEAIDVVHNGRVVASGTLQEALSDPIVEGGLDFKRWSAKSVAIFQVGLLRKTSFGVRKPRHARGRLLSRF